MTDTTTPAPRTGYAALGDLAMYYETTAPAPTRLLLHGGWSTSSSSSGR